MYVIVMSLPSLTDRLQVSYKKDYSKGYKYCTRCQAFYRVESARCPVCGVLLRSNPRKRKSMRFKALEITPDLERELEKIDVKVKIVRKT